MTLVVLSRVFPNATQPTYGLFVRERLFRVAAEIPLVVVAPVAWFPGQGLIRRFWKPDFRPPVAAHEVQHGIDVYHPRFLCIPGLFKWSDAPLLAISLLPLFRRLRRERGVAAIDSHFIYPDGVAAALLGRWLRLPYTITLRGTLLRISRTRVRRWMAQRAMRAAAQLFAVSNDLRRLAIDLGEHPDHVEVVPNGINLDYFYPEDRQQCREALGLPQTAQLLITVGSLNERKGFHRVIEQLPALLRHHPNLHYLCVGGGGPDGNEQAGLERLAQRHGVRDRVHFTGAVPPERLRFYYSAADLFVLATRFEGWANVFLEAAACGLPTVTTRVGGNAEVIHAEWLGRLVELGDGDALCAAISTALNTPWEHAAITAYARDNAWERRIPPLVTRLRAVMAAASGGAAGAGRPDNRRRPSPPSGSL